MSFQSSLPSIQGNEFTLSAVAAFTGNVKIVGICGGSASGKTTAAQEIGKGIGLSRTAVISLDWYYKDLSHLEAHERSIANFDCPAAFDIDLFYSHLEMLKDGRKIESPIYDFENHVRKVHTRPIDPKTIIIAEGLLLFCDRRIVDLLDLKVFLDVPLDLCLCRRLVRDIDERGRTLASVMEQYIRTVRPSFFKYVKPQIENADIVVDEAYDIQNIVELLREKSVKQPISSGN